jgi:preprotein translocase subunit SecY
MQVINGMLASQRTMSQSLAQVVDRLARVGTPVLHIIFVIPMIVNDVNLSVSFRGVSGLSP